MPFLPNVECTVEAAADGWDRRGRKTLGAPQTIKIGIVTLELVREKTSVRTDSSATRGNAEETTSSRVRLLFPTSFKPKNGDKVTVVGLELKIVSVFPRHSIRGRLDHYQVDCDVWSDQ